MIPYLIPRLAAVSEGHLREAASLRYRLRRRWLMFVRASVPPSYESILSHCEAFGCSPGLLVTLDEYERHLRHQVGARA